jgi:hypothetical protein
VDGVLQQFHLVIKYNKGRTNKFADMLSGPPTSKIITLGTLIHMEPFTHDAYKEEYTKDGLQGGVSIAIWPNSRRRR